MPGVKKIRNTIRPAFMRNFTNNVMERYILIEIDDMNDNEKDLFVSKINERLWYNIQKVNEISEYNLPYVLVRRVENYDTSDKLRIIIKPTDYNYNENVEPLLISGNESHIILMKQLSPQRIIQLGNMQGSGKAEILADETSKIAAAIDVFLDIAMFNSISYLKKMNDAERNKFNELKYNFYMKNNLNSYLYIDPKNPPSYMSFAFSQHNKIYDIDYYGYIICWKKFLNEYFPGETNENLSPTEQLKMHQDYGNIDDIYKSETYWKTKLKGAYFLIRTNKRLKDTGREERLAVYFNSPTYHVGLTKLITLQEYHMPYIKREFEELNVSAFKIVVD